MQSFAPVRREPQDRRGRLFAVTITAGVHALVAGGLIWLHFGPDAPKDKTEPAIQMVNVQALPKPPGAPGTDEPDAAPLPDIAPPPPPQVDAPVLRIARTTTAQTSDLLSESQMSGAARAGEGGAGGGGGCDLARAVQQVLRRDPRVRVAVAEADRLGKASMLWNGDWIQSGGQEGKGLAVVRQAVIWEVGFSPAACRNERMHGMVVVALADGRTRFAIGANDWRWSDLLGLKSVNR
jgi:hypothetical protein